jgi:hypothetical protein
MNGKAFNKAKKSVGCDRFFSEGLKYIPCIHMPTGMFSIKTTSGFIFRIKQAARP